MPLHDVGYRNWTGERLANYLRWIVVATMGIRLVWRGTWLRRTIFFTWIPAFFMASGFVIYEQAVTQSEYQRTLQFVIGSAARSGPLADKIQADIVGARHDVWANLLLTFFRYPQAIVMVIVIGMIAPRAISFDLRGKSHLLYFSKPLTIVEYIAGKSMVIWFYLAAITTVPACLMYFLGLLLSPDWAAVTSTWDLPLRILGASIVLVVPTTALALAFSSMTQESRYASFGWIATWVFGAVAYGVLTAASTADYAMRHPDQRQLFQRRRRGGGGEMPQELVEITQQWEFVSPYHVLGKVQQWVFGVAPEESSVVPYLLILGCLTIASFAIIYWRLWRSIRS